LRLTISIFAAAVLLVVAGCSSPPQTTGATKTFVDAARHFVVSYDSNRLRATIDRSLSGNQEPRPPGIGLARQGDRATHRRQPAG
jgi:hypothetical protein